MFGQELDRYWETVVNTIRDGIMIVDTRGRIVSVNQAVLDITGYPREALIGQSCQVLNCDICRRVIAEGGQHYCELFKTGAVGLRKCQIQRQDGRLIHVLKNAALLYDDSGQVIGAVESVADLTPMIEKENQIEAYRRELQSRDGFHGIIGTSRPMQQVFDLIQNAARSDAPVIIYGESGTGKELISRAVHDLGHRRKGPFVKVNCASLTESLLESELFGHVRGAFTGAFKDRIGRFEMAHGGDIFLDEIGDLPLSTQVKLLRVLEEKTIERVGDSGVISADVRIISATNRNLEQLVADGHFRKDFYFRINVIPIHLPALRRRPTDIPLLAEAFFRKIQLKSGRPIEGISNDAMEALMHHTWPGNVRELRSAFECAFVTCPGGMIRPEHLPAPIHGGPVSGAEAPGKHFNLHQIEKQELIEALKKTGGNQSKAAEILGISRVTVWNRMRRFGIKSRRHINVV